MTGRRLGWRVRALPSTLVTREWVIAVAFSIGMASLGAAFGILPDLAVDGWAGNPRLPWLIGSAVAAVLALAAGTSMWWFRNTLLHHRGTAYLVDVAAPGWDPDDKRAFRASIRSQFAAVREVTGPDHLRGGPAWTLDEHGSRRWDEHLTDLVHSFRTLHANDDPATGNALYLWAPWPVALGFGLRTVGGHRGVHLEIRHRPSHGRLGPLRPVGFGNAGLTFRGEELTASCRGEEPELSFPGTVLRRAHRMRLRSDPGGPARPVTVLLVRTSDRPYGPLPDRTRFRRPAVAVRDAAGLGLPRNATVIMHEWIYQPPGGFIAWDDYPAVAAAAAGWIRDQAAAADPGSTILLGMVVPQEIGAGVGIVAAGLPDWPIDLWPLIYDAQHSRLVTVRLGLGRGSALVGRSD